MCCELKYYLEGRGRTCVKTAKRGTSSRIRKATTSTSSRIVNGALGTSKKPVT